MSVKFMARVWAHSRRKDGELLVMLALADFANDAGECWPSIPVLAQKARLTERQTRRVLKKLEEAGEIRKAPSNGGRNRRNHYFIMLSENPDNITGKELQGKNNPEFYAQKTLTPMSGALNRHRTVNKSSAEVPESSPIPKEKKLTRRRDPDPAQVEAFARFYSVYPRHVAREAAEQAWLKLSPSPELQTLIMAAVARYAGENEGTEQRFIKYPAAWLNGKRWEDEPAGGNGQSEGPPKIVKREGDILTLADGSIATVGSYERKYGMQL
jgi:hypothetical protein